MSEAVTFTIGRLEQRFIEYKNAADKYIPYLTSEEDARELAGAIYRLFPTKREGKHPKFTPEIIRKTITKLGLKYKHLYHIIDFISACPEWYNNIYCCNIIDAFSRDDFIRIKCGGFLPKQDMYVMFDAYWKYTTDAEIDCIKNVFNCEPRITKIYKYISKFIFTGYEDWLPVKYFWIYNTIHINRALLYEKEKHQAAIIKRIKKFYSRRFQIWEELRLELTCIIKYP